MKPWCFLPARGGSKRIPGKNKKLFNGRPIIEYAIKAAQASRLFEKILVSTDDPDIAEIVDDLGWETETRPPELYGDKTDTESIAAFTLRAHGLENERAFCMLYATAAFTRPDWLTATFAQFDGEHPIYIGKPTQHPSQRSRYTDDEGFSRPLDPSATNKRTQDLRKTHDDVGDFYWFNPARFLAKWDDEVQLLDQYCRPFIVGPYDTWDIDNPEDWEHAEWEWRRMFG